MIFNNDTANKTSELLLQINAIKLNPKNPFKWASGWNSPIYCDNRITLSFPQIRTYIRDEFAKNIENQFGRPDIIVGVATGAIGIGVLVAERLGLPFAYVRPEAKKHGRQNQIEGFVYKGQNAIVIEDLVSTGKSSLMAVDALRAADVNVKGMAAIFDYGFDIAKQNFKEKNLELYTLGNYEALLDNAIEKNYISKEELKTLQSWSVSPDTWEPIAE